MNLKKLSTTYLSEKNITFYQEENVKYVCKNIVTSIFLFRMTKLFSFCLLRSPLGELFQEATGKIKILYM